MQALLILIALACIIWGILYVASYIIRTPRSQSVTPSLSNPQVVVNVPQDYKPLETLDGKEVVVGERALLWWTVYKHTLLCIDGEIGEEDIDTAIMAADNAVDKVYGL